MDEGGVHLDIIAPEAHHQLGIIERHNSTLRNLLERIVDSRPCTNEADIDLAIASALYAKNSATWSSGRPPYIAAFGKIPRVGLDLINDPRALVSGSTRSEAQQQAALMRCEALKAIAEASASSTLRRALLRKTDLRDDFGPQPCRLTFGVLAWTTRSHRKRDGYRIARYLGKDPNGGYWLQSGSNTVKVSRSQVRNVFGYEEYLPDDEDLWALKEAEENIRRGQMVDETAPSEIQPPDEEDFNADNIELDFPSVDLPATLEPTAPTTPASPRRNSVVHQNIRQTQNIFSPPAPGEAVPHTPSRRRSRTPATRRTLQRTIEAAVNDPSSTALWIRLQLI